MASVRPAGAIRTVVGLERDAVEYGERAAHFAVCQRELVTLREGADQKHQVLETDARIGHQVVIDLEGLTQKLTA